MNGRVEVMMTNLPGGPAGGTGTPKASFKRDLTLKSSMQELVQVSCNAPVTPHMPWMHTDIKCMC